jgi:hypothetical protein
LPERERDGEEEGDWEYERRRGMRRDLVPHRGTLILVLGILSLVGAATTCMCPVPIGAVLGIIAWFLGNADLKKIKQGEMDPEGHGLTNAGWICGIIGTILGSLVFLFYCGYIVLVFGLGIASSSAGPGPGVGPGPAPGGPPPAVRPGVQPGVRPGVRPGGGKRF